MAQKIAPNVKKEYHLARQLCIYGDGDGKPIANVERLAELSGLHVNTIRKYVEGWIQEREDFVTQSSTQGLALKLSAENSAKHSKDCDLLRNEMDQVAWELSNLNSIIAKFEGFINRFNNADPEQIQLALGTFDSLIKASLNKQSLRGSFLTLQARWVKLMGIEALMDVATTKAKSDATLASKLDARKAEAAEGVRDVTPAGLGVFRRGGA